MPEITLSRYMVQAGWNDVPHLTAEAKEELLRSTPPHLRDARSKGDPSMGSGAIYPVPLSDIEEKPFAIPAHWPRAYALDVGWNRTACIWGAKNPDDDVLHLYAEHYRGKELPVVHAAAIKARGDWIRGAIDPAARGRGQTDGSQLLAGYKNEGLKLIPAENAVEAGVYEVWQMLVLGRLRVFSVLQNFRNEYRIYRRDENGKIIKANDHLMDATRYLINTWPRIASVHMPKRVTGAGVAMVADTTAGY